MARKMSGKAELTGNLDSKHWVQKSDPLVFMRSVPFSLGELKILDTYISRINSADEARRTVIFTKEEYEKLMGLSCVDYRSLKKHTEGILGKVVTLEMPNKEYLQFVLFLQARYHKDEYGKPIIELTCSDLAKDLFFCVGKYHYFKYALENVINLTRKASYLLYLHIRANLYRGKWETDLTELRDKVLDCKENKSYHEFKVFKRDVLNPAVKEINAKTDCHFEYEAVKRGRRVVKIRFSIISTSVLNDYTREDGTIDISTIDPNQISLFDEPREPQDAPQDDFKSKHGEDYDYFKNAVDGKIEGSKMDYIITLLSSVPMKLLPQADSLKARQYKYLQIAYGKMCVYASKGKVSDGAAYLAKIIEADTKKQPDKKAAAKEHSYSLEAVSDERKYDSPQDVANALMRYKENRA